MITERDLIPGLMALLLDMTCKDTTMKKCIVYTSTALLFTAMVGCSWHEPTRVENDFGKSVRLMIAEQLYDPEAAVEPSLAGPEGLDGSAAIFSIDGYVTASQEARIERTKTAGSPIPVVGTTSGGE